MLRLLLFTLAFNLVAPVEAQQPQVPEGTKVEKDVAYGKHARQKFDLYLPKSDKPLPLVIWIHGGGWEGGSKDRNPAVTLLKDGYAVAGINYRYSTQAPFPAQLHDCQAAIRFFREHAKEYNIDPEHIGVWGASAGGHLVSMLGVSADVPELDSDPKSKTSIKVQCVVNWFGPTDLVMMTPANAPSAHPVVKLLGGNIKDKEALAKSASPMTHITKTDAPHLIIHGDADPLVPLKQSEILNEALKKASVPTELIVFPKAGHGDGAFITAVMKDDHRKKLLAFFDEHLKTK